jgi:hypothetical protein
MFGVVELAFSFLQDGEQPIAPHQKESGNACYPGMSYKPFNHKNTS